jgi:hypothetical protein
MAGHCPARESRSVTDRRWRTHRRGGRGQASIVLAVFLTACSSNAVAPSSQATPTPLPLETPAQVATPKPTSPPRIPAPAELQGRWRTVINDADQPVLTITDFKYTIERLGIGTGSIEVTGDQIAFFGSNLCSGRGTYQWSIDAGTLTLMAVGADPCANRADAIRGRPFTRIE